MRLLLDENISPALVRLLADVDVYSQSVPHVGLAGRTDQVVWQYALDHGLCSRHDERTRLYPTPRRACSSGTDRIARKWSEQAGIIAAAHSGHRAGQEVRG